MGTLPSVRKEDLDPSNHQSVCHSAERPCPSIRRGATLIPTRRQTRQYALVERPTGFTSLTHRADAGVRGRASWSAYRRQAPATAAHLSVKYRRIASRRGPMKAIVAIEHAMLTAIWNMTATGALYDDPGPDFYTRPQPRQGQTPRHRTTPCHGLHRHARTDRVTKEPLTQGNLRVRGPHQNW